MKIVMGQEQVVRVSVEEDEGGDLVLTIDDQAVGWFDKHGLNLMTFDKPHVFADGQLFLKITKVEI